MLSKIKNNYFILISTVLFLYFFFNLLDGERGLISYFEKKNILKELKDERKNVVNKINKLEIKNSLLTDNLDLDYIEILIREKFLFGKNGEEIYIVKTNEN
jgi:cell division protein FtsB